MAVATGVLAAALLLPAGAFAANGHANFHAVCPAPPARAAHCLALVVTDANGNPDAALAPTGLSPAQIKSVYNFPTANTAGSGQTIAIVDAYDDPTAESDLGVFSSQFGLPACTTANGCFSKVDQNGGTSYPAADGGWALEISLDIQWAHAIAPGAKILLVEAASNNLSDLLVAEDYAKAHAQYVSNSWGSSEFFGESSFDSHFVQSGVSFFVSAGDNGTPAEYPSSSPNVISVGGTSLYFTSTGAFQDETAWSSGGGGCSALETAAAAQSAFAQYAQVNCGGKRATPDLSLDADPASGVSVYDTTPYGALNETGWFKVGGTSASSPMIAARSAVAGVVVNAAYVYGNAIAYRDITSGNNGALCLIGFDLCSGRGSWTGGGTPAPTISSFGPTSGPVGTTVVINGTGLAGTTSVFFNGTYGSFTASATRVVTTVPAGTMTGTITVTTPYGSATTARSFVVTSAVADLAVTYQIGADHSGVQTDSALTPPLAQRWSVDLGNAVSYPLIAAGKVFVTTAQGPPGVNGTKLYALDQASGATLWQKTIAGTYSFSGAAYDNGQVFVVNYDGLLQAFDGAIGTPAWSSQLPGQYAFTSPPTAANGAVYVSGAGSGGTVYAVDEVTGGLISTASVANGDHSSPALANGSVFASYACNQAYGFGQSTLSLLWHYATGCSGGGGKTVVYAGGRVYTRDSGGNLVLDASTGNLIGGWTPAGATALAPAVDGSSVYWMNPVTHTLTAPGWTFSADPQLDTAPILLSTGTGKYVVAGSASGALYALDAATGSVVWQTTVAPIAKPDEQNAVQLTGLGAGQGLLVVPAGNTVTAFAQPPATPAPAVGSFMPTSGPAGTAVTINGSHFTGATAVQFNGTAATSFTVVDDGHIATSVPTGATTGAVSVTTPAGTGSSSGVFTVIVPDFSIGASPATQTVTAGSSASYTLAVTRTGGFAGSVSFSVSGLPPGATASFSPASTSGASSTLTVSTSRSAKTGAATLTITGASSGTSRTATVTLQIKKK